MTAFLLVLALQRAGVAAWDSGQSSAEPLTSASVASKAGWTSLSEPATSFKGDAILSNGRLTLVLRKLSGAVEVYAGPGEAPTLRSRLTVDGAARLERAALVETSRGGVCLEATFQTTKGTSSTARFRLKRGEVFVETEPGAGAERLRVESPGRYVVLPDFFADDMLVDATKIPPASIELPSENFLLLPTGGGDSLAMVVFENREQEVRVQLSGEGEHRVFTASEIRFGKGRKIWTALLEGKGIWHAFDAPPSIAGKITPLGWTMPYTAQWRADFTRADGLTESWEMLLQASKGADYWKPSWLGNDDRTLGPDRKRWIELLGQFQYPVWSDHEGKGFIQPLAHKYCTMSGPGLVYPINRVKATPAEQFTALDVMRSTLGVGPCEYILDVVGQKESFKGNYTCATRDKLIEIYDKSEQKSKRDEIEKLLGEALEFVKHIRGRIEVYIAFGKEMRAFLAEKKTTNPEAAAFLAEMDAIAAQIEERLGERQERIKAPSDVMVLNDEFRKNVRDYEGADLKDRLKKYTDELTRIGGNQDKLVMECRWIVKALRQKAGLAMALDPKIAPLAEDVRTRTQAVLRAPSMHEKARH
ncbi:MAG TPA: hypothetical protein VNM14_13950 [Planctomycetota bacterium]|nr:hypothetical protein [Planctomycetota bacterium]